MNVVLALTLVIGGLFAFGIAWIVYKYITVGIDDR